MSGMRRLAWLAAWLLAASAIALVLRTAPIASAQAGTGAIEASVVVSGTATAAALANLPASLFAYQDGQRAPTPLASVTNARGQVRFEGLNTGSNFTYTVIIRYQETFYRAEGVKFAPGTSLATTTITVPPPAVDAGGVRIEQRHVVIDVDSQSRSLSVAEFIQVNNPTGALYTGVPDPDAGNKPVSLRIPLPPNVTDIEVDGRTPGVDIFTAGNVLLDAAPVPAGGGGLIFSYRVPYERSTFAMAIGTPLTTTVLNILVSAGVGLRGQRIVPQGTVPDTQYSRYSARDLPPGTTIAVELTDLPAPILPFDLLQWLPLAAMVGGLGTLLLVSLRKHRAA